MDSLFDDTEPDRDEFIQEELVEFEHSSSFARYVSEGMALLEDWLRDPS